MVRTYSHNKSTYSVDMMFAYINIFKPKHSKIETEKLLDVLHYKGWYDDKSKKYITAFDVIDNPKKYKKEYDTILSADLKYPIIVNNGIVIDGVHRVAKSYLTDKKYIKCYNFNNRTMKKFMIDETSDWKKVSRLEINVFIQLFYKRFCQ